MLLRVMSPHITELTLGGANQFAYTKERGVRNVLAFLMLRWIAAFENGQKVAVYFSYVAFDGVSSSRLVEKLKAKRLHPDIVKVIESWLNPRSAAAIAAGAKPDLSSIKDIIYQGTVLRPPLWNTFLENASAAIREFFFPEIVYADDLNFFREFPESTPNKMFLQSVDHVQAELHEWGDANQVCFDQSKESKHVLSRADPAGSCFKLLGVQFDCHLFMAEAVRTLACNVRWKQKMLLRARRYFNLNDILTQYKQQILSYIEYRTPAIYHATTSVLSQLHKTFDVFLSDLWIPREAALLEFNLAPLGMRRDIAMLGMIRRAAIVKGPPHFRKLFRRRAGSRLLVDPLAGRNVSLFMNRSARGVCKVYNTLGGALDCEP